MWASQWMTDKIRQWSNESGLPTPQEFKTPTWKRVHTWFSMEHLLQPAWPQEPTGQWRHFMTSIHCWRKYFEKKGFSTIGVFDVWVFSIFNTYFSQIWDILSPLLWVCEMCCCTWRDNGRVNKVHYRWADLAAGSSFPKGPALPWKPVWPTYNCHTSIFSAASFLLFCSLGISRYVFLMYKPNCARIINNKDYKINIIFDDFRLACVDLVNRLVGGCTEKVTKSQERKQVELWIMGDKRDYTLLF